jgi:hypothetical protein
VPVKGSHDLIGEPNPCRRYLRSPHPHDLRHRAPGSLAAGDARPRPVGQPRRGRRGAPIVGRAQARRALASGRGADGAIRPARRRRYKPRSPRGR